MDILSEVIIMKGRVLGRFVVIATAIIVIMAVSTPLIAEFVFMKDGSIVDGTIIKDSEAAITIRTADKKQIQIQRNKMMRILYTKLKMGKVYIQKRDGEGIVAYIVDEDQDSYTFRKELYKAAEFTINRSDVLFIAEKNPSGLKIDGEIGTDKVSLVWLPPYDVVKKYNIYIKKNKADKYELTDNTKAKSITLKNLSSNTTYYLIVTSIDSDDYESPPSNELKITMKNRPPTKPVVLSAEKSASGETKIIWQASTDPDGKVIGYKVSRKHKRVITLLAEVKNTEYTVAKNIEFDEILVVGVDDLKAESTPAVYSSELSVTGISIIPSVIFPVKKFKEMSQIGYGVSVKCDFINNIIPYVTAGVELSFFYMQGESGFTEKESNVKRLILLPFEILAGYTFQPLRTFKITPQLSAGMCYVNYTYSYFDIPSSAKKSKTKNGFDPVFGIGINLRYDFSERLYVTLASNYNIIYEKKENYHYFSAGIGAGMWY